MSIIRTIAFDMPTPNIGVIAEAIKLQRTLAETV